MKTLYLLDGMALAYRAHFAFIRSPIHTSKGFNTSAIFGFTATLIELVTKQKPSHLAVAFDTSAPTHRHALFPEYKANREEMPEELRAAIPCLNRILEAFDIPVLKLDGYEADDIIGTLARRAEADEFDSIYMVTPDKDFGQLVSEKIKLYRPGRKGDSAEIWDIQKVKEKWDISRIDQVIDMLGLCGDSVDNIPGIPGIGPKTAAKLIAKYETVEDLLEHIDELKGKQQEKVHAHADMARLSKKLATIQIDVPVDVDWEDLVLREPEKEKIIPLLTEFELRTLSKRIFGNIVSLQNASNELVLMNEEDEKASAAPSSTGEQIELISAPKFKKLDEIQTCYRIADNADLLFELASELKAAGAFAFDIETTGLNPRTARLVGLSFSTAKHTGWWVPATDEALEVLRPILAELTLIKIGHNLKFDLSVLAENDCPVEGSCYDTLLAHALINPEQRHNLDILAEDFLQYSPIRFSELFPNSKKGEFVDYSRIEPLALAHYAIEDADVTLQLWQLFQSKLEESGQANVFYEIETPLLPVLVDMEREGILVCKEALKNIGRSLEVHIENLTEAIFKATGHSFNLNSPKQLGQVLFDELKLVDKPKKTSTNQYATNERVLSGLASKHPIIADILEYRQLTKLKSTYITALPNSIDSASGRIHTHFGQIQTATGRLSSNNPNLQNIPVRSERGREIRKAFIPRKGWKLLSADYSQIELRILAALAEDEVMLAAFRKDSDIHIATATRIFGIPSEAVTREQRNTAKMVNFGIPYGISAFGLAQRLGTISRTEAQSIINSYFEQFHGIAQYITTQKANAREKGYVETICKRRRYLRDINSGNGTIRAAAERNAINMPIQGTAADMIKRAMISIQESIQKQDLNSRMLLQVHDELVFDMDSSEESQLRKIVTEGMEKALPFTCPICIGVGDNWLAAH